MAMSDRKRLTLSAIAVVLVGIVTGLLLGSDLLPSSAADQQYNEGTTTTTVTSMVHTHDGRKHKHTTTTVTTVTETTPHDTFPEPTTAIASAPVLGTNAVIMSSRSYMPSTITVPVGTTVTWTNRDSVEHSVTSFTGVFNSSLLGEDVSFSYTFNERGTFSYSSLPYPRMIGRVIVE